ncbi:hypothetical protein F5Y08DRAFT_177537 [Xylaria arbuscula]|nr:hypothetical protein F5Y08DRAFT_177537 [Xylaria arbuscula]
MNISSAPDVSGGPGEKMGGSIRSPNMDASTAGTDAKTQTDDTLGKADYGDSQNTQINEDQFAFNELNEAILNDNDENLDAAIEKAQYSQYSISRTIANRRFFEREKKTGVLPKRTAQATIHTAYTELRIQDLEKQLRQVRIDLYKLPNDFEITTKDKKEKHLIFGHVLQHSPPDAFEIRKEMWNAPPTDHSALEVLVVEHLVGSETHSGLMSSHARGTGSPTTTLAAKSLRIRPRPLIAHLQRITRTHISDNLQPPSAAWTPGDALMQNSIVFLHPFKLLVAHREAIKQSLQDLEKTRTSSPQSDAAPRQRNAHDGYNDEDLVLDLRLLVKFMDEDMRPIFDLRQRIKEGTATDIEYQDLWHLFSYGDIVVVQSNKSHAYRVLSFTGGREPLIDRLDDEEDKEPVLPGFMVDCLSVKFDGLDYIPQLDKFCIRPFIGRQPITSLSVYPLKFEENQERLRRNLTEQGQQYLDVTRAPQLHKHLLGRTLDEPAHDIDAQVIIDESMALNTVPGWRPRERTINRDKLTNFDHRETFIPPTCGHTRYVQGHCGGDFGFKDLNIDEQNTNEYFQRNQHLLSGRKADELDNDDLILLPCDIHGFVLRNRQWITLRVADLSDVKFDNSFDELMLPERHKSAIQALVKVHESAAGKGTPTVGSSIDVVKGKGTGLILLLHGEPGVGKTSTAECVADHAQRPLFPITCGDIGETAAEVEKNLLYNFRLAHKWGCVLLLDEADVFLAKRNKTDLRRNAVTSVFLRSLEYYAGILFLTTNRVGNIDPAFKSRIHISLFYPKFDLEATRTLYATYIKRTRAEQERLQSSSFKIKEKEILKWAELHFLKAEKEGLGTWNGRQIRNAFQAAIALAEYDSQQTKDGAPRPTLGKAQFNIVAESSREFDRYLVSTLGAADSDIARREEWRFDRFGNPGVQQPTSLQGYSAKASGFYSKKIDETEEEDDSDETSSDSEDSVDRDGGDDSRNRVTKARPNEKIRALERVEDADEETAEEFREFLEFKRAQKARKQRR